MESRIFGLLGSAQSGPCGMGNGCTQQVKFYHSYVSVKYCPGCIIKRVSSDLTNAKALYDQALEDTNNVKKYLEDHPELGLEI